MFFGETTIQIFPPIYNTFLIEVVVFIRRNSEPGPPLPIFFFIVASLIGEDHMVLFPSC
jgi:hypothetical protein